MSISNEIDVIISSRPSDTNLEYFEITSPDVPIGSEYGFILEEETFEEPILTDTLNLKIEQGGSNPYRWLVRPNNPNKPQVEWTFIAFVKKGGNQGKASKKYVRSAPGFPYKETTSIVVCFDKLVIETSAVYAPEQKLTVDSASTSRDLILRVVTDGSGTYPFEYRLINDGVAHTIGITIINEKDFRNTDDITYLR